MKLGKESRTPSSALHNKLFVDRWFKVDPRMHDSKYVIQIEPRGTGRKKHELCKKTKKKTRKKSG